jgi:hypothetical protein
LDQLQLCVDTLMGKVEQALKRFRTIEASRRTKDFRTQLLTAIQSFFAPEPLGINQLNIIRVLTRITRFSYLIVRLA